MKITKQGVPPKDRIWHGRCRTCQSEAEATEGEMTKVSTDPRDGLSLSHETCPVCKTADSMIFYPAGE